MIDFPIYIRPDYPENPTEPHIAISVTSYYLGDSAEESRASAIARIRAAFADPTRNAGPLDSDEFFTHWFYLLPQHAREYFEDGRRHGIPISWVEVRDSFRRALNTWERMEHRCSWQEGADKVCSTCGAHPYNGQPTQAQPPSECIRSSREATPPTLEDRIEVRDMLGVLGRIDSGEVVMELLQFLLDNGVLPIEDVHGILGRAEIVTRVRSQR